MEEWTDIIYPQLLAVVAKDQDYQYRLKLCRKAEEEYLKILNSLSTEQWDVIENYIALCDDLEYRMTQLAYYLHRE